MTLADELRMWAEADVLDMDSIEDLLTRAADTIARLSANLEAARETLEPFATVGRIIDGPFSPALFADNDSAFSGGCAWSEDGQAKTLTWGNFRRACAVLAKLSEGS